MLCRIVGACAVTVGLCISSASAERLTYQFTGTVKQTEDVFGLDVEVDSEVTGRFSYAYPDTIPDHSDPTGYYSYLESITDGFRATFTSGGNPVVVRASDYVAQVADTAFSDGFSIIHVPDGDAAVTTPLTVGTDEYSNGRFRLDFFGFSFLYNGSAVPSSLTLSDFAIFKLGTLGYSDLPGSIQFLINDLQPVAESDVVVPEPSSLLIFLYGSGVLACAFLGRRFARASRRLPG